MNPTAPSDPYDLVDHRLSPGPKQLYGADEGSNKRFRTDEEVVQKTEPLKKQFTAASLWQWNHGLGFRPTIDAYNASWEKIIAYIVHVDENNVEAHHGYNEAGWLVAR